MSKRTRDGSDDSCSTLSSTGPAQRRELQDAVERRQRRSNEIRTEVTAMVQSADPEGLLDTLYDRWELDARNGSVDDFTRLAFKAFGLGEDADVDLGAPQDFGLRRLDEAIERHEQEAIAVFHAIRQRDPAGDRPDLQLKATKVIEMVYYAKRLVLSAFQARLAVHQLHCADHQLAPDLDMLLGYWTLRFRWIDQTKSTPLQKLLLHLLDTAMEKRYRKHNGHVYEPIMVNGYETHAWRRVCDIGKFVYDCTTKEMHYEQWSNLTASGHNHRLAVDHLSNANDYQFPFLQKDRAVFAFRNGAYLAREDRFHRFGGADPPLSDAVVAAKFFDADFDPHADTDDWRDIPTPSVQCIAEYQGWPADVCDWLYVMLGRLLYNVNERDGWQVIPFMLGAASSGKCYRFGTKVMLFDGSTRAIEDIRVGDLVMGDDSTPRRVLTLARGVDDMYTLVPCKKGYEPMTVTGEHVLCLKVTGQGKLTRRVAGDKLRGFNVRFWDSSSKTIKYKMVHVNAGIMSTVDPEEVIEMTVHEYMALPEYMQRAFMCYRVPVDFATTEEPAFDPWLIGVWLGDGTSADTRICIPDQEIVDGILDVLRDTGSYLKKANGPWLYNVCGDGSRVEGSNPFRNALKAYDLLDNKHIPHALKTGSRHTRMEVLAGLLDTDGYYHANGNYRIIQHSERLADDIVFVARSLGFGARKTRITSTWTVKSGEQKSGPNYLVVISGSGLSDIPVRVERKKASPNLVRDARRWGFDVVPAGREDYYGFQCDGNQRFLLGNFTVTHNSTIVLRIAKAFYEDGDVGLLSNNIEKQFGISAFHDKLLFCGPEVKGDLKIEQAELQSIISGESVQVAAKHKKAFTVDEWKPPGILAGNEVPSFSDNAGSIQRRFLVFAFIKAVVHGDMKLGEKLLAEMPAILVKCNRAYHEASDKWGTRNVWTVLPAYFQGTRNEMAQAVNSVEAFLASNEVVLDGERFCPFKDFKDAWKAFSIGNGYTQHNRPILKTIFRTPFEKYHLRIENGTREYRGMAKAGEWVVGIDLVDGGGGEDAGAYG